jgi:molybdate transport system ATP-binding protein
LGFVSQTFGLFPHLTAAENVGAALTHLRRRERSREAQNCLDIVGIGGLADRRPNELSGGQSQRVAMARALARKPRLLLLDEPFSALDHSTRKRLRVELKRLQDALAMTVLFVTHDLDEAAELSETLVLLRRGKVIQQGPTRELLRRPSTVEAARLMNFANLAKAEWAGSDASGITLRWGDVLLTAAEGPKSQPYDTIHWTIRTSDVFLVKDNHPNESSLGTILPAEVVEVIEMGSSALVSVIVNNSGGEVLRLQLRPGALHRHNLSKGLPVRIALHAQAIVLLN